MNTTILTGFGATMGSSASPMDPLFYAHHMFVDLQWSMWQFDQTRPSNHDSYGGTLDFHLCSFTVYD